MNIVRHPRVHRPLLATALCLSALMSVGAVALPSVSPASALAYPASATDPSFCSDYSEASAGSYAGVRACNGPWRGSVWFRSRSGAYMESDDVGFQCVELATRYLYATKDWGVVWGLDGADLAREYGAFHGIIPVHSGNPAGLTPAVGDVISFSVEGDFTDDSGYYPGHVAVVVAKTSTYIKILSEDWNGQSAITQLGLSGTRVAPISTRTSDGRSVYTPYIEWLPLGVKTPAGYGPYSVVGTGSNGLNERATPSTSGTLVGHLSNGATIYLACQVAGAAYATGGTPTTDSIWDKLTSGAYVADYWVSTPYVGTFSTGIARC